MKLLLKVIPVRYYGRFKPFWRFGWPTEKYSDRNYTCDSRYVLRILVQCHPLRRNCRPDALERQVSYCRNQKNNVISLSFIREHAFYISSWWGPDFYFFFIKSRSISLAWEMALIHRSERKWIGPKGIYTRQSDVKQADFSRTRQFFKKEETLVLHSKKFVKFDSSYETLKRLQGIFHTLFIMEFDFNFFVTKLWNI